MQCRGAKSFVDDLGLSRGVVLSRAAALLRSIETKPFDSEICPLWTDASPVIGLDGSLVGVHVVSSSGCFPRKRETAGGAIFFALFFICVKETRGGSHYLLVDGKTWEVALSL